MSNVHFRSDSTSRCFPVPPIPLVSGKRPLLPDLPLRSCPEVEHVQSRSTHRKLLVPTTSYHTKVTSCQIPGQRPQRGPMPRLPYLLGEFPVPDYLREAVGGGNEKEVLSLEPSLEEVLTHTHTHTHTLCQGRREYIYVGKL